MRVLCVNAGSSTLKVAAFEGDREVGRETVQTGGDPAADLDRALGLLASVDAVGHRIVHGGPDLVAPVVVDAGVVRQLRELVPLAPLHMPAGIAGIDAVSRRFPGVPQVACFDTAFHASLSDVARRLPIPDALVTAGARRYGFHGLSCESVLVALGAGAPSRIVLAHLGNGSSVTAIRDGRSVDTTMGMTPTGGVVMGTRTGDLDPGLLAWLVRERHLDLADLDDLVDRQGGLLAIGGTADVRLLVERAPSDPRARLALDVLGWSVRKAIGAMIAVLDGIDLLVFTGGIGENVASIQEEAARGLAGRSCPVRVIPADEDRVVAAHVRRLVRGPSAR